MPRKDINYSNTTIYKICCKDITINQLYIGHTTDMRKRKNSHKSHCNKNENEKYNLNVYQFIRANGGWDNWDVIEVERFNAIDGYDATKRERYWIEQLKATLNMVIPTRTIQEWYEDNKENLAEKKKEYYVNNKEIIAEKIKEWREDNKEYCKEKSKEYYGNNKDTILVKKSEKVKCECGCEIRRGDLLRHKKSQKHIKLML